MSARLRILAGIALAAALAGCSPNYDDLSRGYRVEVDPVQQAAPPTPTPPAPPTPEELFDERAYREGWALRYPDESYTTDFSSEGPSYYGDDYGGPAGYVKNICAELDNPRQGTTASFRLNSEWEAATEMFEVGIPKFCPQHTELLEQVQEGNITTWEEQTAVYPDGRYIVGEDIPPGTYQTTTSLVDPSSGEAYGEDVRDCYWERIGANGETIDNEFITFAPDVAVTISSSDVAFVSENCGAWTEVG